MKLAALKSQKAKLWVNGRKNTFNYLESKIDKKDNIIWIHSPSLGEFEQARPLIEILKKQYPEYKILASFFSPSGYEVRKNYEFADYISYLPLDTKANAKKFINLVKPKYSFFIKYDFWANYLNELQAGGYKHYVVSAIFRDNQYFFKWHSKWMLKVLAGISHYFVQNKASEELLRAQGIHQVSTVGDTRFDRVIDISKNKKQLSIIEAFKQESPIFIGGSTWPIDEEMIVKFAHHHKQRFKYIIAPHEIEEKNIAQLQSSLKLNTLRYSKANNDNIKEADVLIIDNIGLLSSLYAFASIAYIGGGFGAGIHNTLEAAVYGMPILFGPENKKFQEAQDLMAIEAANEVGSAQEMIAYSEQLFIKPEKWEAIKTKCADYVQHKSGASHQIIETVFNLPEQE